MENENFKLFHKEDPYLIGAGFVAGAIVGYCNAKGIYLQPQELESSLKYAPTVLSSLTGMIRGGVSGIPHQEGNSKRDESRENSGRILEGIVSGAVKGAASTAVGYGFGNTIGKLF